MKKGLILFALIFIFTASSAYSEYKGEYGSYTDPRDGYTYKTVKIGEQEWFAENLRTTKYKDGTDIPNGDDADLQKLAEEERIFYFNPNGDEATVAEYGRLYTYFAAIKAICPKGWHAASDVDWLIMELELGMPVAEAIQGHFGPSRGNKAKIGAALKEEGSAHWPKNNSGTNTSGMSIRAAGYRTLEEGNHPKWAYFEERAYFVTTTRGPEGVVYDKTKPLNRAIRRNFESRKNSITRDSNIPMGYGFSVRCVKGDPFPLERQMQVRPKGGKKGKKGKKGGKK